MIGNKRVCDDKLCCLPSDPAKVYSRRRMIAPRKALEIAVGLETKRGGRSVNEDYAGCIAAPHARAGCAAALADGVGGAKGGRVAAELAVRRVQSGR